MADAFHNLVLTHTDSSGKTWFENEAAFTKKNFQKTKFLNTFSRAIRYLGLNPVNVDEKIEQEFKSAGALFAPQNWEVSEVARVALLLRAGLILIGEDYKRLVLECFYKGDNREKKAVLRSLIFLPEPKIFLDIAVEACRTNVQTVFESIACDNPYPAVHFPDLNFNQMVLKALFTGSELDRILGWQERNNTELIRMAGDYASERKAAKREVPSDIQKILDNARSES